MLVQGWKSVDDVEEYLRKIHNTESSGCSQKHNYNNCDGYNKATIVLGRSDSLRSNNVAFGSLNVNAFYHKVIILIITMVMIRQR